MKPKPFNEKKAKKNCFEGIEYQLNFGGFWAVYLNKVGGSRVSA